MNESVATVSEISRRAGCSIATVSRVLNNSGAVSPQTREAVAKAVQETHYLSRRPVRRRARSGEKAESAKLIEIVEHRHSPVEELSIERGSWETGPLTEWSAIKGYYGSLSNSFYRPIVNGAVAELSDRGYGARLRLNANLLEAQFLAEVNNPDSGGVLLMGEYSGDLAQFIRQCQNPLVLVDLICPGVPTVVTTDNFAGIKAAFEHVRALGHRSIGYIGRQDANPAVHERFTAFRLMMIDANLPLRPEWIYEGPDHFMETVPFVQRMLQQESRPTALLCSNDSCALAVLRAAGALGIPVPGQLSVVGFDDSDFSAMVTPALTTVRVPLHELGRCSVRELMIRVQTGAQPQWRGCQMRLTPELVVRQSTAAPPV